MKLTLPCPGAPELGAQSRWNRGRNWGMVPPDEPRFAVGNVGIALVVGFSISVFCVLFCVMSSHLSLC